MYETGKPSTFLRDGIAIHWLALVLVGVVLGGLLSGAGALAVERGLDRAVTGLVGEYGEYDFIVHIRTEAGDAGPSALQELVQARLPGARLRRGPTVAGQWNYFLDLPEGLVRPRILEAMGGLLATVPGYNGYTLLMQPTLTVGGLHPTVRSRLEKYLLARDDVRFVWRRGDDLVVQLRDPGASQPVTRAAREFLGRYHLVEVRLPLTYPEAPRSLEGRLRFAVEGVAGSGRVTVVPPPSPADDLGALTRSLQEMRDFLLTYAAEVQIVPAAGVDLQPEQPLVAPLGASLRPGDPLPGAGERLMLEILESGPAGARALIVGGEPPDQATWTVPVFRLQGGRVASQVGMAYVTNRRVEVLRALDDGLTLVERLDALTREARAGTAQAGLNLQALEEALATLSRLEEGISALAGGNAPDEDRLLPVVGRIVLGRLLGGDVARQLVGGAAGEEVPGTTRLAPLKEELSRLTGDLEDLRSVDLAALRDEIARVRAALPRLSEAEIGRSVRLVDSYLAGKVIPGGRVQLLVSADVLDEQAVRQAIGQALPQLEPVVLFLPAGSITPDARTEILSLLGGARQTVAALLALFFALVTLGLDHATVLSTWRRVTGAQPLSAAGSLVRAAPFAVAGGIGATLVAGAAWLAGGAVPWFPPGGLPALGFAMGVGVCALAPRLAPVSEPEFLAGESLGLTYEQIFREIVVPAGRPGLLMLLNRARQEFP